MLTIQDVLETNQMIQKNNLDVRTITMGISLLDCCASDGKTLCNNIYDKITKYGEHLVETGEAISREYGVPIINKRVSVTPISLVAGASDLTSYVDVARTLDKAAKEIGINFIGGFSALVERGMSKGDRILIDSIAESLAVTDLVCSSVAVGSTKAGINMDAVAEMGRVFKDLAERTKDQDALGCAKLVVFSNAVEDNPFMAGAFHGVTNGDSCISVGNHQEDGLQDHPRRTARRHGSVEAPQHAFRHHRLVPGSDTGCRRQRRFHPGRNGPGKLWCLRYDGSPGPAQRRRQERRSHGFVPRRRPVRRFHPGQ